MSAEIIAITLGTVQASPLATQVAVLGGILMHGIPGLGHWIEPLFAGAGAALQPVISLAADAVLGVLAGALTLAGVSLVKRLR